MRGWLSARSSARRRAAVIAACLGTVSVDRDECRLSWRAIVVQGDEQIHRAVVGHARRGRSWARSAVCLHRSPECWLVPGGNLQSGMGVLRAVVVRPLNDPSLADGVLVERARRGDVAAFEQIVERYQEPVFRVAYLVTRSSSD